MTTNLISCLLWKVTNSYLSATWQSTVWNFTKLKPNLKTRGGWTRRKWGVIVQSVCWCTCGTTHTTNQWSWWRRRCHPIKKTSGPGGGAGGISVSARHQHTGKTTSHIHSTCSFCISRRALFYKDVVTVVKVLIVPPSSFSYMLSPCDKQRPPKSNSKSWVVKQDNSRRRINSASYWSPVQQINMGRAWGKRDESPGEWGRQLSLRQKNSETWLNVYRNANISMWLQCKHPHHVQWPEQSNWRSSQTWWYINKGIFNLLIFR